MKHQIATGASYARVKVSRASPKNLQLVVAICANKSAGSNHSPSRLCGRCFACGPVGPDVPMSRSPQRLAFSLALQIAAGGLLVAGVYAVYGYLGVGQLMKDAMRSAIYYIESSEYAMTAYLAFTVVGVVALVPTTAMEFSGGFLFVPKYGLIGTLLLTCAAKFVANLIAITLAKYVFREWVRKRFVENSELLSLVAEAAKDEPYKMVFLVRGSFAPLSPSCPVAPFFFSFFPRL